MNLQFIVFLVLLLCTCCVLYVIPDKSRKYLLLLVSIAFFGIAGIGSVLYAMAVVTTAYFFGKYIEKGEFGCRKKSVLTAGIFVILSFLLILKYVNNWAGLGIAVPLGLSYYTLMAIGYFIDVYRGEVAEKNFFDFCLFLTFFPQVMAGPIGRSKALLTQWKKGVCFDAKKVTIGFMMLLIGLFEKMVLADHLFSITGQIFGSTLRQTGSVLFVGMILYTLQIYFDFAGYSLIAVGGAKMLGIDLIRNFDSPFFSCSIKEFWRRWHISLSSWFRDYLYIPLGGSRVSAWRINRNLLIVFLVSGIWHGTTVGFAIWGILHGLYQIVGRYTDKFRERIRKACHINGFLCRCIQRILVFFMVAVAFVPFRLESFYELSYFFQHLFVRAQENSVWQLMKSNISIPEMILYSLGIIFVFVWDYLCTRYDIYEKVANGKYRWRLMLYVILILVILCAGCYGVNYSAANFIYGGF